MKYTSCFLVFCLFVFSLLGCVGPPERNDEQSTSQKPQPVVQPVEQKPAVEPAAAATENSPDNLNTEVGAKFQETKIISVYLPKIAQKNTPMPVVFIFDPGANGNLPIGIYQPLADKFGYALVSSNVSKNGQEISQGLAIFKQMKKEFSGMQTIDEKRVYTLGFSGGARVAASIAMTEKNISGVIGCGAGLPFGEESPDTKFDYFGMVGNQDFNMTELIRLDISLKKAGFNNDLYVYDGKHAWPPEEVMKEAFFWLETNAMKKQTAPKNGELITEIMQYFDKLTADLERENRIYDASKAAERAVYFLKGLTNITNSESRYNTLSADSRCKAQFEKKVKIRLEEMGEQNKLLGSFTTMDVAWWTQTVNELNKPLDDLERQNMNRRLITWLGLVAYLSSNNALKKGQTDVAGTFLEIYGTLEPANPERAYLGAVLQMQLNKPDDAIGFLKKAVSLGFKDSQRMSRDTAFIALQNRNDFKNLLQGSN